MQKQFVHKVGLVICIIFLYFTSNVSAKTPENNYQPLETDFQGFDPIQITQNYVLGTTYLKDKMRFYDITTENLYDINIPLAVSDFIGTVHLTSNNRLLIYTYRPYVSDNRKIYDYNLTTGTYTSLIETNEAFKFIGATDDGMIYTIYQNNGDNLWYYDFATNTQTKIANDFKEAHISGDVIVYSDANYYIHYATIHDLTNIKNISAQGFRVKTNGQAIAYWSGLDRYLVYYHINTGKSTTLSNDEEGSNTNFIFGDNTLIWNSYNTENDKYATHFFNITNHTTQSIEQSLKPISATDNLALMESADSSGVYYLVSFTQGENPHDDAYYFEQGKTLMANGNYQEAINAFDQAIQLNKNHYAYYLLKGECLFYMAKYEEAIVTLNKSLSLQATEDGYYLSAFANMNSDHYLESLQMIDLAIGLNNNSAEYYDIKGYVLTKLERYEEALNALNKGIQLNDENRMIYLLVQKGNVLIQLQRLEEAIYTFDVALTIEPSFSEALEGKIKALENQQNQTWKEWQAKYNVESNKVWTIKLNKQLNPNSISQFTIYVKDANHTIVASAIAGIDGTTAIVKAPVNGYQPGATYTLYITKGLQSQTNTTLKNPIKMNFTIAK